MSSNAIPTSAAVVAPDARISATGDERPSSGTYTLVPTRSAITFATKHIFGIGTLAGGFDVAGGQILVGDDAAGSRAEATIDAGSFRSGNARRDRVATSGRFFDVAKHPQAIFRTERIREVVAGSWAADGVLTIKGVDSPLQIRIDRLTIAGGELSFHGTAVIDRYAAGVNKSRGVPGQMVDVELSIVALRDRAGATA